MEEDRKIVIKLDAPYRIKYEGIDEFGKSIFKPVYKQASQITREIVEKNQEYHKNPNRRGNDYRNNEQIYNVISFVGGRGSGKTSCMLSFAEFLKDYHRIGITNDRKDYFIGDNLAFIGINAIDAGLLEEKEDIVDVVLANLLERFKKAEDGRRFNNSDYDFKRREFNQCLQKIYKSNKYRKQDVSDEEFFTVNTLSDMAVSVNMRESFKELIIKYIELMKSMLPVEKTEDSNCFVIIPIDDIDMNITKGYLMLEQIRRYLMVPNVIVLLSYKYEQLMDICNLYYKKKQKGLGGLTGKEELKHKIVNLSSHYMEKVIPDGRRITLTTVENVETFTEEQVYIVPAYSKFEEDDARTIEQTFLRKIARCFDIRSWTPTGKMSFWKSHNLRNLSNLYNELHVLKDPCRIAEREQDRKLRDSAYNDNYMWLFGYIEHKAMVELLEQEYKVIKGIMGNSFKDMNRAIVEEYFEHIADSMLIEEIEMWEDEECYGHTLYILYKMKNDTLNPLFIDTIQVYISAMIGNMHRLSDNPVPKFMHFMGLNKGFSKFDAYTFPDISFNLHERSVVGHLGSMHKINNVSLHLKIDSNNKIIEKDMRLLETVYMFLGNIEDMEFAVNESEIEVKIIYCDFRILNFIINVFNFEEHLKFLHEGLDKFLQKEGEGKENYQKAESLSIKRDMIKWSEVNGSSQLLPFCDVELILYILEECMGEFSGIQLNVTSEEYENAIWDGVDKQIYEYIIKFLYCILDVLDKQDNFYKEAMRREDEAVSCLGDIFRNCPVVENILQNVHLEFHLCSWFINSDEMIDAME